MRPFREIHFRKHELSNKNLLNHSATTWYLTKSEYCGGKSFVLMCLNHAYCDRYHYILNRNVRIRIIVKDITVQTNSKLSFSSTIRTSLFFFFYSNDTLCCLTIFISNLGSFSSRVNVVLYLDNNSRKYFYEIVWVDMQSEGFFVWFSLCIERNIVNVGLLSPVHILKYYTEFPFFVMNPIIIFYQNQSFHYPSHPAWLYSDNIIFAWSNYTTTWYLNIDFPGSGRWELTRWCIHISGRVLLNSNDILMENIYSNIYKFELHELLLVTIE